MQCIRVEAFGGPEVLRLVEAPVPVAGPGEVVVEVRAIGVNPVDTYIRSGAYGAMATPPYTPGSDAAGVVSAVGKGVSDLSVGDRVYTWRPGGGAYAQFMLCAEHEVFPLPDNCSFEQGAALGVPYATATVALMNRGGAVPGDTVLIHGASGGVGTAAVQIALAAELTVIGTAGSPAGLAHVTAQGAQHVFKHHEPDYRAAIMAATGGSGVNLIIEMAAHVNLGHDLEMLAHEGRVVIVGSRGEVTINPRETMKRDADIRGMTLFNVPQDELPELHEWIYDSLEAGLLNPVIGRQFPLSQAAAAHEAVLSPGALGKIILLP